MTMMIFPGAGNNQQKGGKGKWGNHLRQKIICKNLSTHARQSCVQQKSPPTTVTVNPSLCSTKRRGPGYPWKYPDVTAGNIQANNQAHVNAGLIQAEDLGIWYCSTHYKLVKVQNGVTSWKGFLWHWMC